MIYKLSKGVVILENDNRIVIANTTNGHWVRLAKEVYNILKYSIDNKMELSKLKSTLADQEDILFIENLYTKLLKKGFIVDSNTIEMFSNKTVSIEMTHRCNLKCIHCCIDADGIQSDKVDLTTEQIKKIFTILAKWNPNSIMLSGGEPMLRHDFNELLIYLRSCYSGTIIVSTNGTLINEDNVHIINNNVNQVDISLDGVDEESCALIRGSGIFGKVVKNIKLLQKTGFKNITLSMATSDKNAHLEERFLKLNQDLGTRAMVRHFAAIGRGKTNRSTFTSKSVDEIYIPEKFKSEIRDDKFGVSSCSAGKREIFIAYDGMVYPCPSYINSECKLGNILEVDDLEVIVEGKNSNSRTCKAVESRNPIYSDKCRNCNVNLFCWTCPASVLELNAEAFDKRCIEIKPILSKKVWG